MRVKRILSFKIWIILLAGCSGQSHEQSQSSLSYGDGIQGHAQATYIAHVKAVQAGTETSSTEVPPAYWADKVRELNPLKVYRHFGNIVIVQRVNGNIEEGKYICIITSSHLPSSGVDGFVFSPNPRSGETYNLGNGVFDYQRTAE